MSGPSLFRCFAAAILLACALFSGHADAAHAAQAGMPLRVCVAPAHRGQIVKDLFDGRITVDCRKPQTAFGAGDFWVLSAPLSVRDERALRSGSVWQKQRTVYALYGDGVIVAKTSDAVTATRNLQLGAMFLDRLPARDAPLVRLAWKIEGSANLRGIVNGPRLATIRENGWANLTMAAIYAAFAGLCVALIVHHLALWTAMRHRFQLAYCVMVSMLLVYAFSSSGALAWAFPSIDNNDRLRINYASLGLTAAAALMFARTFFEDEVFRGWVNKANNAIAISVVLISCAYAALAPWQMAMLDRLFALSYLALVAFVPVFLVRAWMVRSNYLWLFALAWAAPVLFAGLRVANNLNLIGWNFWVDNSTLLSMTAEALLSSVGISYRIRLLGRERDEARAREIMARALADTDPLTGLLNRRAFLRHAIGRDGPQQLLILDIDHFKSVNETIGHDGGDEVLRLVARALRSVAPVGALVSRIGGEEFALLTPEIDGLSGEEVLARLRAERMPFDMTVTASIGGCVGPLASETDWKRLYRHADRALYEAKAEGRDRARTGRPILAAA